MRVLLVLFAAALPSFAVTLVPLQERDLVRASTRIVAATVVQASVSMLDPDGDGISQPWATITVHLDRVVRGPGSPGDTLTFLQMGGSAAGRTLRVDGMPAFAVGDRALLCLNDRLLNPRYTPIVGWAQGVWRLRADSSGADFARREFTGSSWMNGPAPATPEESLDVLAARLAQEGN